jgi:hypothetical protein
MYDSNNVYLVVEQVIDDAVRPLNYLTNVYIVCFWYDATRARECRDLPIVA